MTAVAEVAEPVAPAEETPLELDALERDLVDTKIPQLRSTIGRLSLDSMGDPSLREELIATEHELAECELELRRIGLARSEQERRRGESEKRALDERQQAAFQKAQQLQAKRQEAAAAFDKATAGFVDAAVAWVEVCREQARALRWAGRPALADIADARGLFLEQALARAMRDATWHNGALHGTFERMKMIAPRHQKYLAENDAKPVEPLDVPTTTRKGK